ncbi:MAG: helix-turn-helix domain-containing protein [Bacteroidetes bacterium]|nr:helix-turn-helix domain-containing protein [Bacteroidota bacterium]
MNLKEFYTELQNQPTPQKEFREKIANKCGVTEMTVYRWLSGEIIPEKLKREKIAEITGLSVDDLFPNLVNAVE